MTINGDSTTGKFDDVNPIPVTFNAEHILSVTIEFGDMAMNFDLTDISAENNYGWGQSFNGTNNRLTVTNNSTCAIGATVSFESLSHQLDFFFLTNENKSSVQPVREMYYELNYQPGETSKSCNTYVRSFDGANNAETFSFLANYLKVANLNKMEVTAITIELKPQWQTL